MKILLIRPNSGRMTYASTPPVGLGYLASNLQREGFAPKIIDLDRHPDEVTRFIRDEDLLKDADLVGVQVYSRDIRPTKRMVDWVAARLPKNATLVLGGPHATIGTKHALEYFERVNYAIVGEADRSIVQLAKSLKETGRIEQQSIGGLAWLENGELVQNDQDYPEDLDALGFPAWELIPPDRYHCEMLSGFAKRVPAAVMLTGRGCPFRCKFCSARSMDGHIARKRSIPHVMEEISFLHKTYGTREIKILDDNFSIKKNYVLEFCKQHTASGLDVIFSFPCGMHINSLDDDVLAALKSIHSTSITVALESGSQRIVNEMKKSIDLKEASEKIRKTAAKGFEITACFIIGYKGETVEDLKKTIALSVDLPIKRAHFNSFCPFPGTEVYDELVAEGRLENLPWHLQHFETINYSFSEGIDKKTLSRWRSWALIRFYLLRPQYILRLVLEVRSKKQLTFLLKKGLEYLGFYKLFGPKQEQF